MSWSSHVKILIGTFFGLVAAVWLFVLAMNPYGNLPNTLLPEHVMMDDNQRYQYPSIVRSGRYDSIIIGTSTSRLLEPATFERALGGRFANIAINAGTAWEQIELAKLFLRHQQKPHALVVGPDHVWCAPNADRERITFRGFPEWMYDENPWNDLVYTLNSRAIEIAGRRLAAVLGLVKPRLPIDGWEIFTPPERDYDLGKAQSKIYGNAPRLLPVAQVPPATLSDAARAAIELPALAWLDKLIGEGKWQRVLIVFPPIHFAAQPIPGTLAALHEAECKDRIAKIGARHKAPVLDFRIDSEITRNDENYWDPLHYRIAIAERVARGIAEALRTGQDDPRGDWKVLVAPSGP